MNFPHGVTVTLVSTTTTKDEYGDATTETVTYEWGPCAIAPRYSTESADSRTPAVVIGKTIYGPPLDVDPADLTIDTDDTLVLPDGEHLVEGVPGDWQSSFTGWHPGIEVAVKRATGV